MSTTKTRPEILFVPGAWHVAEHFSPVVAALEGRGYVARAVTLPSVGAERPLSSRDQDVAAIRNAVSQLVEDESKEVVLVLHSYGGMPGSESLRGLGQLEREKEVLLAGSYGMLESGYSYVIALWSKILNTVQELTDTPPGRDQPFKGKKGGVIHIVYLAALLLPEGFSLFPDETALKQSLKTAPWRKWDNGYLTLCPDDQGRGTAEIMYNDLAPADAEKYISLLKRQSADVFLSQTTYAGWKAIPSTYLLCEKDMAMVPPFQEFLCSVATKYWEEKGGNEGGEMFRVERLESGHSPHLSQVRELVDLIGRVAGEGAA
ncbi:hypothetical protein MMC25_006371 [Agyrium rufum]|nr:hypothetical protein [Agyrium rufum]